MKKSEIAKAARTKQPVILCASASHDEVEYKCIQAIVLKPKESGGFEMSVDLLCKSGNSITRAKPENIKLKETV